MADPAATDDETTPEAPRSATAHLVALQRSDTELDQLAHRRERLAELGALAAARSAATGWEADRDALQARVTELGGVIEQAEVRTGELAEHITRLEAQLKTVIAPREAEALMHEIATLAEERDAVETAELEALESQTEVEDRLAGLLAGEPAVRDAVASAERGAAAALADHDAEAAAVAAGRDGERERVPSALLGRYDRMRGHQRVAVAELEGRRCTGCHLDLSAAEVDDVKDEAAGNDGVADCPQCGRMLVV